MSYNRKRLKETVASRITDANYNPRTLSLIHSGVFLLGLALVLTAQYILYQKIAATGGLSGIGTRTVLETVQAVLLIVFAALIPFWRFGIYYSAVEVVRKRTAGPDALTAGFYRFSSVLLLKLLQILGCMILVAPCVSVGVSLLSATPWYAEFEEAWLPILEQMSQGQSVELDGGQIAELLRASRPVLYISLMIYTPAIVYLSYRVRMAKYLIMDDSEDCSAFRSLIISWRMTRRRLSTLISLDVSFLWFGALKVLAVALAGLGPVLVLLEIPLPVAKEVACFGSMGLGIVLLLVLSWLFGAKRRITYAIAYDGFRLPPNK